MKTIYPRTEVIEDGRSRIKMEHTRTKIKGNEYKKSEDVMPKTGDAWKEMTTMRKCK